MKPLFFLSLMFLVSLTGCTIKLAPETQTQVATLGAQKELVYGYAQAAKTPNILSPEDRTRANQLYDDAFRDVAIFTNAFELQLKQTGLGRTVAVQPLQGAAEQADKSLNEFILFTRPKVDARLRTTNWSSGATTIVAIAAVIQAAKEGADFVQAWWNGEAERQRQQFLDFTEKVKLPLWTAVEPVKVQDVQPDM